MADNFEENNDLKVTQKPPDGKDLVEVPEELKSSEIIGTLFGSSSFRCCPWAPFERPGPSDLLQWKLVTKNNSNIPNEEILDSVLPNKFDRNKLLDCPSDKIQVTWIGHATVYVQFDGISILTDPVFEESCGPNIAEKLNRFVSYKRYRKAPCKIQHLPALDAVVISHNHYDHLEESAIKEISEHFKEAKWFVTLKQKELLEKCGGPKIQVTELNWWEEKEMAIKGKTFKFICTPSQHWCQREVFDKNKVLWCSWVIKGPTKSFYFAGDTGYYERLFKTIGQKYGPFDLAAIPIGAYEPRYITEFQHVDPADAVNIHNDVKSKHSIGIHWGTFELTNEFYAEPPQKVEKEIKRLGLSPFISLCHGQTWCAGDPLPARPLFMDVKPPQQSRFTRFKNYFSGSRETSAEIGQPVTEGDNIEQNPPKANP